MSDNDTVRITYKRCQNFLCYSASAHCTCACSSAHAHVGTAPSCNNIYVIVVNGVEVHCYVIQIRLQVS